MVNACLSRNKRLQSVGAGAASSANSSPIAAEAAPALFAVHQAALTKSHPVRNELWHRSRGFSLVELTVVLLLITLITSVAVRETSELGFQVRYDQTKERLDIIKQAILGNPKQIINGQQAISGFVADMGRLPNNLRELIHMHGYCLANRNWDTKADCEDPGKGNSVWINLCSDSQYTDQASCETNGQVWAGKKSFGYCLDTSKINETTCLAAGSTWTTLFTGGWNGPYMSISGSPADVDAITDAWGTTSNDQNYGWRFEQGLYLANLGDGNVANDQTDPDGFVRLVVQSLGKDQVYSGLPGSDYDSDYPPNQATFVNDGGTYYPSPLVDKNDWLTDISNGVQVLLNRPSILPPHNHCTKPSYNTKTNCEANDGVWLWGCETGLETYKDTVTCPPLQWKDCSKPAYATRATCEANNGIWFGDGKGCNAANKSTKAECSSSNWKACSINTHSTKTDCETNGGIWFGEYCSNSAYATKVSCEANGKVWQSDEGYGCNPFSTDKAGCSGTWSYFERGLCMRIHFRASGVVDVAVGHAVVLEDGLQGSIIFKDFDKTFIPSGNVAVGIYYKHGTQCTNIIYPDDSHGLSPVVLLPKSGTPVINW